MEGIIAVFIPIASFIMVFGIVYVERTAKHREIMAALEKGIDPKELKLEKSNKDNYSTGYTFAGAGFGVFVGYLLTSMLSISPIVAYLSMGFLFGGLALIYANKKLEEKRMEEDNFSDRLN